MKNIIKDKSNMLVENILFSDVLGDAWLDSTPKIIIDDKKEKLFKTVFMEKY